jgi:hypothetical protein
MYFQVRKKYVLDDCHYGYIKKLEKKFVWRILACKKMKLTHLIVNIGGAHKTPT